ncbi:hypothetical protein [Saccharopolyspora sp. ASAGF58]|uniref:hypothetical protein n=1 Tax=Saccharopolyspora sp. ASAGF58 TaxID=2719023 RepID=UPI00143FD96A|nr:hypothetical protein [Saccharopolyspora sp. ASAGF58]QIZ33832.1 hypothetical protein FDZ84_02640 [Saccharopolyspora sp. ASAGF58]
MAVGDGGFWGQIGQAVDRMADNVVLAAAQNAGGAMRIDPDQVDAVANFFQDEAENMQNRADKVQKLSVLKPAGKDPVSQEATKVYRQVGAGDGQAYMENYLKLADVFHETAKNLRASAKQTRTDDQNAAESL